MDGIRNFCAGIDQPFAAHRQEKNVSGRNSRVSVLFPQTIITPEEINMSITNKAKNLNIAYIGGGSRGWAWGFMMDLAMDEQLCGVVRLYDIDRAAAERNEIIGGKISAHPDAKSRWQYEVSGSLKEALTGADFVVISILPGTFDEMASDVHLPERVGVWQPVGDTVGPGGFMRAMRTIPMFVEIGEAIRDYAPDAWVINYTNPMTLCIRTLYEVFPAIKAFGCCHEVFHTQTFLTKVLKELKGIEADRREIYTDACGINHFTWITEAKFGQIDLLSLLPEFMDRFYEEGYYEGDDRFAFNYDTFAYGNKVKLDLFRCYGALAAAGDRHLAEFVSNLWYLRDPKTVEDWKFGLTTVDFRETQRAQLIEETIAYANGSKPFPLNGSTEEAVDLMKALLGFKTIVSNVNLPNRGQMQQLPLGSIVETNCVFSNGQVKPVVSNPLPTAAANLVYQNCVNIDTVYEGIKARDLSVIFSAFVNQPLCSSLTMEQCAALFREMCENTRDYLEPHFDLEHFFQ